MILRTSSSWQTLMADLTLILFLVTAQAVATNEEPPEEKEATAPNTSDAEAQVPISSSALAVHRPSTGDDIGDWLATTVTDERQMATISITYAPDRRIEALIEGERLLAEAADAGVAARLIAMPDTKDETLISVDFLLKPETGTSFAN